MKRILLLILIIPIIFTSCKYNKMLKSTDSKKKYDYAMELYNKKDFARAMTLFEQLIPVFRGTEKGEEVFYYYTYCNYNVGDYIMAGYYFRKFATTYPNSKHTEECYYMSGYCYYLDSPKPSLDQDNTKKALEEFQFFVTKYPKNEKVAECNKLMDALRAKLAKKQYMSSKMYLDLGLYKAASVSFKYLLTQYADSPYREEVLFYTLKSDYLLASNSIDVKKEERYDAVLKDYDIFVRNFPQSKFMKDAKEYFDEAENVLKKIRVKTTTYTN